MRHLPLDIPKLLFGSSTCVLAQMFIPMAQRPLYTEAACDTKPYCGKFVPPLGLVEDCSLDFNAYVLKCEPNSLGRLFHWYCGLAQTKVLGCEAASRI